MKSFVLRKSYWHTILNNILTKSWMEGLSLMQRDRLVFISFICFICIICTCFTLVLVGTPRVVKYAYHEILWSILVPKHIDNTTCVCPQNKKQQLVSRKKITNVYIFDSNADFLCPWLFSKCQGQCSKKLFSCDTYLMRPELFLLT